MSVPQSYRSAQWQTAHLAVRQHSLSDVAGQLVHHLALQTYLQIHNRIGHRHIEGWLPCCSNAGPSECTAHAELQCSASRSAGHTPTESNMKAVTTDLQH